LDQFSDDKHVLTTGLGVGGFARIWPGKYCDIRVVRVVALTPTCV